jgi:hypothetical protein
MGPSGGLPARDCRKKLQDGECDKVITVPSFLSVEIMLSVIIPTEGAEHPAVATLAALIPGAAAGVVREVLLVDRGESGVIERVADVAGCRYLAFDGPRAAALAAGARQARSPWLMFLHAGAVLDHGWIDETVQFIQRVSDGDRPRAGVFRYARSPYSERSLRDGLNFLARMIAGPFSDQGLLIARDHYERLGGHAPTPHSEARLLRQLGRSSLTLLRSRIIMA